MNAQNEKAAKLQVSFDKQDPDAGWFVTTGSDTHEYWFRFTGGFNEKGRFHAKKDDKQLEFVVALDADKDYEIGGVSFADSGNQLWLDMDNCNKQKATIVDANTKGMSANYSVLVIRRTDDAVVHISCDPMISNDPRN